AADKVLRPRHASVGWHDKSPATGGLVASVLRSGPRSKVHHRRQPSFVAPAPGRGAGLPNEVALPIASLRLANSRSLFRSVGPRRCVPVHRTPPPSAHAILHGAFWRFAYPNPARDGAPENRLS